jgi:hypothetical protein
VRAFSLAGGTATEMASFFAYDQAFSGGVTVAAADLTGDGVAEVITGAGPSGGPHVRAFSLAGGTATEVASFFAYDPAFLGGVRVAAVDLNRIVPWGWAWAHAGVRPGDGGRHTQDASDHRRPDSQPRRNDGGVPGIPERLPGPARALRKNWLFGRRGAGALVDGGV